MTPLTLLAMLAGITPADPSLFTLQVVDEATGRGVPLVELRTVANVRLWTDSAGVAVFDEPGQSNQRVWFGVTSPGYELPPDGFGFRGRAFQTKPGSTATIKIKRTQIAERLYRVTGSGIYRDSVLAGRKVPLREPLLNGQVVGQDSVLNVLYRGKLFWVWGDTNRPSYPLGNFHVPGATSLLPDQGGLAPEQGVELNYFVDDQGFARELCRMPGEGPTWITSLFVLPDADGRERLIASYVKVKPPLTVYARGLARFNDDKQRFEPWSDFDLAAPLHPTGHAFLHKGYVYFSDPFPRKRVPATLDAVRDPKQYEGFVEGTWKLGQAAKPPRLVDRLTGRRVTAHGGSVYWNAYRRRWVMIFVEAGGKASYLGEVWYAEAESPAGPWGYAVQVATHPRYSFYNPKQHPLFDQRDGRVIYFEGTYTHTFSGNHDVTPRYEYNQLMYRLDLADERLAVPAPVREQGKIVYFALNRAVKGSIPLKVGETTWYGLSADQDSPATIPLYAREGRYVTTRQGNEKPVARVWPAP